MLDSIYVAASGLNSHQKGLKVISNNTANMNTPGFKGSSSQFTDVFLAESGDAHGQNLLAGGGVDTLPTTINFQAGEIRSTGRDMDMALDGPGFFVVRDSHGQQLYTKSGRFEFNSSGELVTMDGGLEVLGYTGNGSQTLMPITLDALRFSKFATTSQVTFQGNLSSTAGDANSSAADHTIPSVKVYDKMGTLHDLKIEFEVASDTTSTATPQPLIPGTWNVRVFEGAQSVGTGQIKFTASAPDPLFDRFTIALTAKDGQTSNVDMIFGNEVTGNSSGTTSTLTVLNVDGNAAGTVSKTSVDSTGAVIVTYTNTLTATGPKLAVAEFTMPEVLSRASGALFSYEGTDPVRYVDLGKSTKLVSGSLELSNIDLTDQFSNMILIQRGFQASSQVLSTASEMIQSLYDIKSHR
ncbi:MAG: flagellar hook-basal body complex protein [Aquabacterium sp.]